MVGLLCGDPTLYLRQWDGGLTLGLQAPCFEEQLALG
jgi:hypothetical protein